MKNSIYVLAVLLVCFGCQIEKKIGYVENGTVINGYQEKKDIESKYQAMESRFNKKADSIGKAFQLEVQQTQIDARRATQKRAQELMQGLQQKQQLLQQQMQLEQQQLAQAFQAEIDSLIVKVKDFVKTYGKDHNYTYILGTSDAAASVLYGIEENNLTQVILDALNANYSKE